MRRVLGSSPTCYGSFIIIVIHNIKCFRGAGNPEGLGPELLETLVKMAPTKEEEIKLKDYNGETSKLGSAERFLKAILDIPLAFKRVEAMLYRANFDTEVAYLRKSFQTLEVLKYSPFGNCAMIRFLIMSKGSHLLVYSSHPAKEFLIYM